MNKVKIVIGMMAGVVAGLIIGILFAPGEGSETRQKISEKGGEIKEEIKNKFHQFGEYIHEKLDGTKGGARHLIRTGKSKF